MGKLSFNRCCGLSIKWSPACLCVWTPGRWLVELSWKIMEHLGHGALAGGHKTLVVGTEGALCPLSSLALCFLLHSDGRYHHLYMLWAGDAQPPRLPHAGTQTPETVSPLKLLPLGILSVTREVTSTVGDNDKTKNKETHSSAGLEFTAQNETSWSVSPKWKISHRKPIVRSERRLSRLRKSTYDTRLMARSRGGGRESTSKIILRCVFHGNIHACTHTIHMHMYAHMCVCKHIHTNNIIIINVKKTNYFNNGFTTTTVNIIIVPND